MKILENEKALGLLVKSIFRLSRTEIWPILYLFGSFFTSHLKILTFDQLIGQNISNLVRMPKYGHMVYNLVIFIQS